MIAPSLQRKAHAAGEGGEEGCDAAWEERSAVARKGAFTLIVEFELWWGMSAWELRVRAGLGREREGRNDKWCSNALCAHCGPSAGGRYRPVLPGLAPQL